MPNRNTNLTVRPELSVTEVERHLWHTRTTKQLLLCQLKGNRQMMTASGNAVEGAPETFSIKFDADGRVIRLDTFSKLLAPGFPEFSRPNGLDA